MYEQEIAARPRNRNMLTPLELTRETLYKLQSNDPNNIPIVEVLEILSMNKDPGHITYPTLIKKAQSETLLQFDAEGKPISTLQNLSSAYAEAIVLKKLRNNTGNDTSAVFEPVTQAKYAVEQYSAIFNIPTNIRDKVIKSFGNKTPDILFSVPRTETRMGNATKITYGAWNNIIDPKNPTDTKRLLEYSFRNQDLFSPLEVTLSARSTDINNKIKKFEQSYKNPFSNNPKVAYVPILVIDYDNYKNISDKEKPRIVERMRRIGGFISLQPGLQELADRKAIEAATQLTSAMQSRKKDLDKQETQKSLSSRLFEKSKKWFNNVKQSFTSNNKPQKTVSTAPKGRLASEIYQEMILSLKDTESYPQKAGIDIFDNSEHLDLMLAKQLARKDPAYEKILKQSPNYRSKEPAEAELWFENMLRDGVSLSKEYYLDSSGSQKIIRSYDNDKSRPPEKSAFEKIADPLERYNPEYSRDKKGLFIAVATAVIKAGKDPEQVLRQSPDYLSVTEGNEASIEEIRQEAESAVQAENSRTEQQAQRDSQRDRGYER
jgi:hypothetical protein